MERVLDLSAKSQSADFFFIRLMASPVHWWLSAQHEARWAVTEGKENSAFITVIGPLFLMVPLSEKPQWSFFVLFHNMQLLHFRNHIWRRYEFDSVVFDLWDWLPLEEMIAVPGNLSLLPPMAWIRVASHNHNTVIWVQVNQIVTREMYVCWTNKRRIFYQCMLMQNSCACRGLLPSKYVEDLRLSEVWSNATRLDYSWPGLSLLQLFLK